MSQRVYGKDYLLAEATVPSLEWFCIIASEEDSTYPADWIPRLFMGNTQAPRLHHLCLSGVPLTSPFKFCNLSHPCLDKHPALGSKLPAVSHRGDLCAWWQTPPAPRTETCTSDPLE